MKRWRIFPLILTVLLLFSACEKSEPAKNETDNRESGAQPEIPNNPGAAGNSNSKPAEADFSKTDSDMFTDRDSRTDYKENTSVLIRLNGDSISCSSGAVKISGTTATITDEGTYILSGTLNNGMIIVNAEDSDKLQLVLNGVSINSETSAPIYIPEADKVFITLAPGTTNTLSNGGVFTAIDDNNIDAAIFSKQDLTLNGSGALTVTSPAGHGIVSKDDLVFTGGTYTIESASHGLDANDSVRIKDASITIDAGKDGIHSENSDNANLGFVYISSGTLNISAQGDGISSEAYMQIEGGSFNIASGGGSANASKPSSDFWGGFRGEHGGPANPPSTSGDSSTSIKGIKSSGDILINNGTFKIDSADDSVHSNGSIIVNGGTFEIASGDDGVHADEELTITAGTINITESYEGLEALNVNISGGDIKLVATDDGINAAGGTDSSGFGGFRGNDHFGGYGGGGGGSSSAGTMVISGGNIYIRMGGDGVDSNGSLSITGGTITVSGANSGDTAILDFDTTGNISGGTFIGTGATGMAQNFSSSSTQGAIMVKTGTQSSGTTIKLNDSAGNVLVSHTADRDFSCVIISHASIVNGGTYTLTVGSSTTSITMTGNVYGSGGSGGPGGFGGMGGKR